MQEALTYYWFSACLKCSVVVKFYLPFFQEYIKSLCNPELDISVPFSEQFYNVLFKLRDDLERTTSAVVKFPSRNNCTLEGSAEAVTLAQSLIEDKIRSPPNTTLPHPSSIEPQLREFAIKLGYSNQVIDQAVQKLGTNVTQNTLLNELLKTTASLPYQISASSPQPKPAPAAVAQYPPRREVVARGAPNTPPAHMLRAGYENPTDKVIRASLHGVQPNWDRDAIARGASAVLPRPSYELPSDVLERGIAVPRGTKRVLERPSDIIARGSSSVQPLMQLQPYSNPASTMYDGHREAGSSGMSASDRLDEEEKLMYQQILGAKKVAGNSSSNLRPVVIDGSNVAMR